MMTEGGITMTRKQFCTEGTWEGAVIPHTTLWKERQGYPRDGEFYVDGDDLTYECGQDDDYDRSQGKTTVWKVKQTTPNGQVCPDCGVKVCGVCGYGIDKEGQRNDACCTSLQVPTKAAKSHDVTNDDEGGPSVPDFPSDNKGGSG